MGVQAGAPAQDGGSKGFLWPWPQVMGGWGPRAFTRCLLSADHPSPPVPPAWVTHPTKEHSEGGTGDP